MSLDRRVGELFGAAFERFLLSRRERMGYGDSLELLYADAMQVMTRPAKRVRPVFLLTSASLFGAGDRELPEGAMEVAIALELLHTFILIHDDVIDQSPLRRGLPTYHKLVESRLGNQARRDRAATSVSIVVGDMLYGLALETAVLAPLPPSLKLGVLERLLSYITDTGAGEVQDVLMSLRDIAAVSREDVERMYWLKTTRYTIECPIVLGAMIAGASPDAIQVLCDFAEPLGLAFQIQNDLAEIAHFDLCDSLFPSDLMEGKKTLVVLETCRRLSEPDRSFLQLCLNAGTPTEASIHKLRALIAKSGAEQSLREEVAALFVKAYAALESPALPDAVGVGFRTLAESLQSQMTSGKAQPKRPVI